MLRQKSPKPFAPNGCRYAVPCASRPTCAAPNSGHPWPSDNRRLLACRAAMLGSLQGAGESKPVCFYRQCVAKPCKQRICAVRAFAFPAPLKHAERRSMARGKGPHVRAHGCASSDRPAPCQTRRASARSADVRQARMVLPTFAITKVGRRRRKLLILRSRTMRLMQREWFCRLLP